MIINCVRYIAQNTWSEVRYGMSHFQTPNTSLTHKRLRDLSAILEDTNTTLESRRTVLRELHSSILPGNDGIHQMLLQWYRMTEIPVREISTWIDTRLIPTMNAKCSELAKKRRQTPRRRYTLKRKESKSG
jgi:hypothetical protein